MSTPLSVHLRTGRVVVIRPDLGPRRLAMRELFATEEFVTWAEKLPDRMPIGLREVSPAAEMNEIAARFVSGARVVTTMRGIMPTKHGVVRLMTTSFYLLGWADGFQRFVLSRGVTIPGSKDPPGTLTRLKNEVVAERKALGVDWDGRSFHELFCFQG